MKFQGDVTAIPITDVVQNLAANRKSGVLSVFHTSGTRKIVIRNGSVVSYGDNDGETIQEWFRHKNLIDSEILRKAEKRVRRAKKKTFGEILATLGGMEPEVYQQHVQTIVEEGLYETFALREATFEFEEGDIDVVAFNRDIAAANLCFPAEAVIMEAARRMDTWQAIRLSLPSENDIYVVADAELEHLEQKWADDPAAREIARLLDGSRSIRDVVSAAPLGRFDALRIVADLVSNKLAKPIDGNELVRQLGQSRSADANAHALVGLKAALEREPGNRTVLQKVAELSLAVGDKEEAAVYSKLLAQALFEDKRFDDARRELRRSLELNPRDIGSWQKLYDFTKSEGNKTSLRAVGLEMVARLRALGLNELARDQLVKMLKAFPGDIEMRQEHAEALFALGKRTDAGKRLLYVARDLFQRQQAGEAEAVLAKLLEYDPKNKRAREIYEQIRNGQLERRRARRRTFFRGFVAALLLATVGAFLGYDLYARKEFSRMTREIFAEGLTVTEDYERARERLQDVLAQHPFSLLRFFEGRGALTAINERLRKERETSGAPRKSAY